MEILSPSTAQRDLTVKKCAYEASGVSHYWVVDPVAQTLTAFRQSEGKYALEGCYSGTAIFSPAEFPGLEISLPDIRV